MVLQNLRTIVDINSQSHCMNVLCWLRLPFCTSPCFLSFSRFLHSAVGHRRHCRTAWCMQTQGRPTAAARPSYSSRLPPRSPYSPHLYISSRKSHNFPQKHKICCGYVKIGLFCGYLGSFCVAMPSSATTYYECLTTCCNALYMWLHQTSARRRCQRSKV